MNEKLIKWLIFGVLLSLIPLAAAWLCKLMFGKDTGLENILSQGELLLITAGLCAAGVGELLGSGSNLKRAKIISGGLSIIILLFAALTFSLVANPGVLQDPPDAEIVMISSAVIYICAFASSGACVYLAE